MDKNEIIARIERIARCAIHTVGEPPFIMSLDDGIAVHEAIDIIQRSQQTGQWIPCEERLPEKDQLVLCQCRAGIIDVLRLKPNGFWENLNPYVTYMPGFVIAWMPLPEPYGGERKDDE